MVVPFGVSVGDFVSTLGLVRKVLGALAESHGSVTQYQDLISRLDSLKGALKQLESLEWEDGDITNEVTKITQRLDQSLKKFHGRIAKFHKSLGLNSSSCSWKQDAIRKIQFTFVKDDVNHLEVELLVHASSLQIVLEAAKAAAFSKMQGELYGMKERMVSAEAKLDETYSLQASLNSAFARCALELRTVLSAILKALLTPNAGPTLAMPRQICFDEPLTLQDACGKYFPVHREWTNCWEAFFNVLQIQFKDRPGLDAVKARNYKLQDGSISGQWTEIDVQKPYEEVFKSGGRWDQLMVFPYDPEIENGCAKCGRPEEFGVNPNKVECQNPACNLCYSRAVEAWKEVLTLPAHFAMPSNVGIEMEASELAPVHGEQSDQAAEHQTSQQPQPDDQPPEDEMTESDVQFAATLQLEDFRNVYFGRSPPVYLRDLNGRWLIVPWPIFRTHKGLQFLADHFCSARSDVEVAVRDWTFGFEITGSDWESRVYYGMVAELIARQESTRQYDASGINADSPTPTWTCHLCRKAFFTRVTLGRHAKTHLRKTVCPSACPVCNVL